MVYPALFQPYLGSRRLLLQNLMLLFVHATFANRDPVFDHRVIHVLPGPRDAEKKMPTGSVGEPGLTNLSALSGAEQNALAPLIRCLGRDTHCWNKTPMNQIDDHTGIVAKSTKILRPFQIRFHLALWVPTLISCDGHFLAAGDDPLHLINKLFLQFWGYRRFSLTGTLVWFNWLLE